MAACTVGLRHAIVMTLLPLTVLFVLFIAGPCEAKPVGVHRQFLSRKPSTPRQSITAINAKARPIRISSQTRGVQRLAATPFNGSFCGFQIRLNGQTLNRNNVRLSSQQAASVAGILDGETLQDKMYIWCRQAHARIEAERSRGRSTSQVPVFDVEKSLNYQGDIRLNLETVDRIFSRYQTSFLRSNGRAIPRLSSVRSFQRVASNSISSRRLPGRRVKRKILSDDFFYWTNAEINYQIKDSVAAASVDAIRLGIEQWEQHTCLRFIEHDKNQALTGPHIKFEGLDGCWSLIGQQANGQTVSVGIGCEWAGIAAHEIGHALGYYHEQSRTDRDNYVTVQFNNIQFGLTSNFDITPWETLRTSGVLYDYSSVMHYGPTDFSFNGKPTIEAADKSMDSVIGQREGLTFSDLKVANINYCSKVCGGQTLEWDQCQHGGYRHPNNCNECLCPKGFAPPFCENLVDGLNANCGQTELTATSDYQFLSSPGYDTTGYNDNSFCAWKITAPSGHRVLFEFVDQFEYDYGYLNLTCDTSYVEVRRAANHPGKRFCNKDTPSDITRSSGNELVIIHVADPEGGEKGFRARYKIERCGGCSANALNSEPACSRYEITPDNQQLSGGAGNRLNSLVAEVSHCCQGFSLQGSTCSRDSGSGTPPPSTSAPTTPSPTTPSPTTPAPTTPAPTTPAPTTPAPTTPAPTTPAPTPAPTTPAPTTPAPTTPAPTTPAPTTPAPTTPAPTTPAPTTPAPTTPPPTTPPPTTPAPTTPTPATPTPTTTASTANPNIPDIITVPTNTDASTTQGPDPTAPDADGWGPWGEFGPCSQTCGLCGGQVRTRQCLVGQCSNGVRWSTRRCPENACTFSPVPLRGCYYTQSGRIWCLPVNSQCFMGPNPQAVVRTSRLGGEEIGGVQILGTVDENTGSVMNFNGPSIVTPPPSGGNGGNGRGVNERGGGNGRSLRTPRPIGNPRSNPGSGRIISVPGGNSRSNRFNRRP